MKTTLIISQMDYAKLTLIFAWMLFIFILGFIAGGNGHTRIVKDDGTVCAEIK